MPINDFSRHPLSWQPDRALLTRPRYLALAARLAQDIESGELPPGIRLPPQRELADWLDLNFTTVTRAYDICRERGLLYGITGRGTFVAPLPGKQDAPESGVTDLGAVQGFPSLSADMLVETARDILERDYTRQLFSYSEREGNIRHRSAGAFWASRLGISVSPDQITVFPGTQNALMAVMLAFFNIGDTLAVDAFTYGNLIDAARLARIRLVALEGDDEGILPAELEKAAAASRIRGIFLMPTCANPTTVTMTKRRKDELSDMIRKLGLLVLEDDATLTPDGSGTFFERLPEQTFHISGSTRFLAPGLRVTFVISPVHHLRRLRDAHHRLTIKASALDAEIMSELILSGRAQKILDRKMRLAKEMNALFEKTFPNERRYSSDTPFFRTVSLPYTHLNGPDVERELHSMGVRICHSCRFSVSKKPSRSFLRLSLCSVNSKDEMSRGLKRVKLWLKSLRRNTGTSGLATR